MTRTLLTVRQFAEKHPAFCEGSLRWLIFNAEPRTRSVNGTREATEGNGMKPAIVRVGRRVLIDEVEFFRQIERLNHVGRVNP
jgi:hypothetical protein